MTSTEESWTSWLCDLEAEDYSFINDQSEMNGVDASLPSHDHEVSPKPQQRSFSADSTMSNNCSSGDDGSSFEERAAKTLKTSASSSSAAAAAAAAAPYPPPPPTPSSYILSFNPEPMLNVDSASKPKVNKGVNQGKLEARRNNHKSNGSAGRSAQHAHDHIIAERMRRSKISQQFIALSALIPGLKKMDKATVLGDAIKYVKELQEKVKLREEQCKRKSVESVVYVEKSPQSAVDEDVSDTSSNSGDGSSDDVSKTNRSMPEVEARVWEKNVLIRIHCAKQKGVLMYVLKEIEKLHLSVTNSSTLLFGTSIVDITITAKVEGEFSLSVKELARNLRAGLSQFL